MLEMGNGAGRIPGALVDGRVDDDLLLGPYLHIIAGLELAFPM